MVTGIGGLTLKFGAIEITGIATALIVGILTNLLISDKPVAVKAVEKEEPETFEEIAEEATVDFEEIAEDVADFEEEAVEAAEIEE